MRVLPGALRRSRILGLLLILAPVAGAAWASERIWPLTTPDAGVAEALDAHRTEAARAPAPEQADEAGSHAARLALYQQRLADFRAVESRMWAPSPALRPALLRHARGTQIARRSAAGAGPSAPVAQPVLAPLKPAELQVAQGQGDADCLAQAVYFEARSEPAAGQAAVAQVVLNRVRSPYYPKSVCGVVFQGASHSGCQFSFACDGSMHHGIRDSAAYARAQAVAAKALQGDAADKVLAPALNYHADYVRPKWASRLARLEKIGRHIFYQALGAVLPEGGAQPAPKPPVAPAPDTALPAWA